MIDELELLNIAAEIRDAVIDFNRKAARNGGDFGIELQQGTMKRSFENSALDADPIGGTWSIENATLEAGVLPILP